MRDSWERVKRHNKGDGDIFTRNDLGECNPTGIETDVDTDHLEERVRYLTKRTEPSKDVRIPTEKSTLILVAIVCIFVASHSFRLSFKIWEVLWPASISRDHWLKCYNLGR